MVQQMVTFTNHAIARVGFKLCGTPGILEIVATFFCQIMLKTKKKKSYHLSAEPLALYHILNPALVIALRSYKRLDESLK